MGLISSKNLLIISGQDYNNDNYRLERGSNILDLVSVSSLMPVNILSADSRFFTQSKNYYVGVSSVYYLKWDWPTSFIDSAIVKGKTFQNGCISYTRNSAFNPNTNNYGVSSFTLSTYNSNLRRDTILTNRRLAGLVSPCLVVPASADPDNSGNLTLLRTFLDYSLSGGAEAMRFYVSNYPKFQISAYLLSTDSTTVIGSAIWEAIFYETSAIIYNFNNNNSNNWYLDVSGFMFPNSALPSDYTVRWDLSNNNEFINKNDILGLSAARYKTDNTDYPFDYITLSGQPFTKTSNPKIDDIRFYFSEPGRKYINFNTISSYFDYNNIYTSPENIIKNLKSPITTNDEILIETRKFPILDPDIKANILANPNDYYIRWNCLLHTQTSNNKQVSAAVFSIASTNNPNISSALCNCNSFKTEKEAITCCGPEINFKFARFSGIFPFKVFSSINLKYTTSDPSIEFNITPSIYKIERQEFILDQFSLTSNYFRSTAIQLQVPYYNNQGVHALKPQIKLSAVTVYSDGNKFAPLDPYIDEGALPIRWQYETDSNIPIEQTIYFENKAGGPDTIDQNNGFQWTNPSEGDTHTVTFYEPANYSISAYLLQSSTINNIGSNVAIYKFSNFLVNKIYLLSSYNSCALTPYIDLSAVIIENNKSYLLETSDQFGNQINLQWGSDIPNSKFYNTNNIELLSSNLYPAFNSNPVRVYFDPPKVSNIQKYNGNISIFSPQVIGSNKSTIMPIEIYIAPEGLDLDFNINYEKASLLPDGFYRFITPSTYTLNLKGLFKPSNTKGWYSNSDFRSLPESNANNKKVYYYFNNDKNSAIYGVNTNPTISVPSNYNLSSITFGISCYSLNGLGVGGPSNYTRDVTFEKTLDLRIYKDSYVPTLSAFLYPAIYYNNSFTGDPVRSLVDNPSLISTYNVYPSTYGEGRTVKFLGSAFNIGGSVAFNDFTWHISEQGNNYISQDDNLNLSVQTALNTQKSIYVDVGGFNTTIKLQNQTLSTYKSDTDGSSQIFKNWKSLVNTPIKIVNYDSPSSKNFKIEEIFSNDDIYLNIYANLNFPSYSPVKLNTNDQKIYWKVYNNLGEDFSKTIIGPSPFSITIPENYKGTTLYVNASVLAPVKIPDYVIFGGYPNKTSIVHIPNVFPSVSALDIAYANFIIESNIPNSVFSNDTETITAIRQTTVSGTIKSKLPYTNYSWVVSSDTYTNTSWTSAFNFTTPYPYKASDYPDLIVPITLNLTAYGRNFARTKDLLIKVSPTPQIFFYPENTKVELYDNIKILSEYSSFTSLSAILYRFENDDNVYKSNPGQTINYAFSTVGDATLHISSIDIKGLMHELSFQSIVNVIDKWEEYNPFIKTDIFKSIDLPYTFDDVRVAPNEWAIASTINRSLQNIYHDINYADGISNFYTTPPYQHLGWYGYTDTGNKWNLFPNFNVYSTVKPSSNGTTLNGLVSYSENDDYICLAYNNKIEIRTNSINSSLIAQLEDDSFQNIANAFIDNKNRIIIFEKNSDINCIISSYNFDPTYAFSPFRLITKWGGLGDAESKLRFRNLSDMLLDYEGNLIVADTGNRSIKRYTATGSWLSTITSNEFNQLQLEESGNYDNGSVISAFYDRNKYTYGLTKDEVMVFDENDNFKFKFNWRASLTDKSLIPVKIISAYDNNIIYILCETQLLKYTVEGVFLGIIGETPQEFKTEVTGYKFVNVLHGKNRVLNLVSDKFVLKYSDFIDYIRLKPDIDNLWWCFNDIKIKEEEFVEYWVYNRAFSRLWDNLEYFRTNLFARILETTTLNGKKILKFYYRKNYAKPQFKYQKKDIFIGANEFVTSEVINRCLGMLYYSCIELLNMVTSQETSWRWLDTVSNGLNATTYEQTKTGKEKEINWSNANG